MADTALLGRCTQRLGLALTLVARMILLRLPRAWKQGIRELN